ncbi:MAG: galactokinase [Fimbriimonadaceae bacterium]
MSAEKAIELYKTRFSSDPEVVLRAPGRVNLIGEHTDYNDGFVFPAAIDAAVYVAAGPTSGRSRFTSYERGPGDDFDAASIRKGELGGWMGYAAGMAWALREFGHDVRSNVFAASYSEVPIGSGVSSSAAIEMAFGWLWNYFDDLGIENKKLAEIAQHCEIHFVGVSCGIMDQMASAMGKLGHALFLDTRTLEIEYAPIPEDVSLVLCNTGKTRALSNSAYNQRRSECEQAAGKMGVKKLRDATLEKLVSAQDQIDDVIYRRARHVITENDRCVEYLQALKDHDLKRAGELMYASHDSLRDDYEVSCQELDVMVEAAKGSPGCFGARMTGAGFGGGAIALVETERVGDFVDRADTIYRKSAGPEPSFLVCKASQGAGPLETT